MNRGGFSLGSVHLGHLFGEGLSLGLKLLDGGSCFFNSCSVHVKARLKLLLLSPALRDLGVTERFSVSFFRSLLIETVNHVLDETTDLAEWVAAGGRSELGQSVDVILGCEILKNLGNLGTLNIILLSSSAHLKENLNTLRQDLPCLGDGLHLTGGGLLALLPFGSLGGAVGVEIAQVGLVRGDSCLSSGELSLSFVKCLFGGGLFSGCLVLAILVGLDLGLARIAEGSFGLILHVLEGVEDTTTLGSETSGGRLWLEGQIFIISLGLDQGLNDGLLLGVNPC